MLALGVARFASRFFFSIFPPVFSAFRLILFHFSCDAHPPASNAGESLKNPARISWAGLIFFFYFNGALHHILSHKNISTIGYVLRTLKSCFTNRNIHFQSALGCCVRKSPICARMYYIIIFSSASRKLQFHFVEEKKEITKCAALPRGATLCAILTTENNKSQKH